MPMINPMSYGQFINPMTYLQGLNPSNYAGLVNPATYSQWLNPSAYSFPASAPMSGGLSIEDLTKMLQGMGGSAESN
jgi:hypothetical protein